MNKIINNPLLPQKISFNLKGGLNSEYPLDLRATASFLLYFQHLIDKSYCTINNIDRIRPNKNNVYKVVVKDFTVGSLSSDLMLIVEGARLTLPLLGLSTPESIWTYTCYACELASRFFNGLKSNTQPKIEINGNNNTVIYTDNTGAKIEYPQETYEIANKSIPTYRKLSQTMVNGSFSEFKAHNESNNAPPIFFSSESADLYNEQTMVDETPEIIQCNIIRFDKETRTGKLRLLDNNCGDINSELPFQIIGNQDSSPYIAAMNRDKISMNCIREISYASLKPKITRLQIISLVTTEHL